MHDVAVVDGQSASENHGSMLFLWVLPVFHANVGLTSPLFTAELPFAPRLSALGKLRWVVQDFGCFMDSWIMGEGLGKGVREICSGSRSTVCGDSMFRLTVSRSTRFLT